MMLLYYVNIYIFIASMIWRFTYICYTAKEQQEQQKKVKLKQKENT